MLRALGIIAEFNPLHNGHRHLIRLARQRSRADVTVVVMSGNWVQRGQPAVVDKWARTKMALANGADLVIELPVQFAVQPADEFAFQAVRMVSSLKCRWLAFGCEDASWDFNRLARIKVHPDFKLFHHFNESYAALSRQAFYQQTGVKLDQPNDLLGLNYARAKRVLQSRIRLLPIQRHNQRVSTPRINGSRLVSSTFIRQRLFKTRKLTSISRWVPANCIKNLSGPWFSWSTLWPELRCQLIETSLADLRNIYQMNEGLEYRLKRAAIQASSFRQFLRLVKAKRYTYARLRRLCFYVLVQFKRQDWLRVRSSERIRILGFNPTGRRYLHQIKKRESVPLITVVNRKALNQALHWEFKAGMLIEMVNHRFEDRYRHPIIR